jgi:MFS family permease
MFIQEESESKSIRDQKYLPFMLLISLFHVSAGTAEGAINTILPLYLKNQILLSTSIIGLFFTISSIVMLLIQIPSGWLADKFGRKKVLIGCLIPLPFLFGSWLVISDWRTLLVIYTLSAALWSMSWPSSVALLSDNLPSELVASALGIRMTSIRLGQTFGPLMAGYLYSFVSFTSPFLASSIILAMSILIISMLKEKS